MVPLPLTPSKRKEPAGSANPAGTAGLALGRVIPRSLESATGPPQGAPASARLAAWHGCTERLRAGGRLQHGSVGSQDGQKPKTPPEALGERLRQLRKARGYTQVELAHAIGTSQRMIAYYEAQGGNVSADGSPSSPMPSASRSTSSCAERAPRRLKLRPSKAPQDLRLMRKLRQVEKTPAKDRRSVLQLIDALVEKEALKRAQG